jgi:transketolase
MQNYSPPSEKEYQQNTANDACELTPDSIAIVNSGHLDMPHECSKIGAALFGKLLRLNPLKPALINRDRLLLSSCHGSMFLSWLHFS